jgi:hypothetical protein
MAKNEYVGKTRAEYLKEYQSQPEHPSRQKQYKLDFMARKKEYLREHIGDSCEVCGTKENLELDHINPLLGGHHKARGHRGCNTSLRHIDHQLSHNNLRWLCKEHHTEHSNLQRMAAWRHFINLPLAEQEALMLQYKDTTY